MNNITLDTRVYPIDNPERNTLAFASVAFKVDGEDLAAIRGIRVVDSKKGAFVAMPQSQDKTGLYHDIAFPIDGELRKNLNASVLDEYERQSSLPPEHRGYQKADTETSIARQPEDVKLEVKIFPIDKPNGDTLAFASVALDDIVAIRGIRVVNSGKGNFVSLPQSQDREGKFHDIAFPIGGDLRRVLSNVVLGDYRQETAERKQGIGERLQDGAQKAAAYAASAPQRASVAKGSPGIGD